MAFNYWHPINIKDKMSSCPLLHFLPNKKILCSRKRGVGAESYTYAIFRKVHCDQFEPYFFNRQQNDASLTQTYRWISKFQSKVINLVSKKKWKNTQPSQKYLFLTEIFLLFKVAKIIKITLEKVKIKRTGWIFSKFPWTKNSARQGGVRQKWNSLPIWQVRLHYDAC